MTSESLLSSVNFCCQIMLKTNLIALGGLPTLFLPNRIRWESLGVYGRLVLTALTVLCSMAARASLTISALVLITQDGGT